MADLPEGGTIQVTGEAVEGTGGRWWPMEVPTANGDADGYTGVLGAIAVEKAFINPSEKVVQAT